MRYVIAVSGGVDSVVLLDKIANETNPQHIVVAHFDHGIRPDSAEDEAFVREKAGLYGMAYEFRREELGADTSEELARDRRYAFLREVAKKYSGVIVTAHHKDDLVESIAINLSRGTGWRGVAVLDSQGIERPLLDMTKKEIIGYARENLLEWREDPTNKDAKYLRNAIRRKLEKLDDGTRETLQLYRHRQVFLKHQVDKEVSDIIGEAPYSRYLFTMVDEAIGMELLRAVFVKETGSSPVRPQLVRALYAVKTLQSGKVYEVSSGLKLRFTKTTFIVEVAPVVLS